jgi:hypothetical protein
MASPYRSESFTHIKGRSTSPHILLVLTRDEYSYEVVLEPILTALEPEEASPEQEHLLAIEPASHELALVEAKPPSALASIDEPHILVFIMRSHPSLETVGWRR